MAVRIVTDSTSDITPETAQRLGIAVVAQNVHFGMRTFKDNVTIAPDDFYSMLTTEPEFPKTSQASVGDFKKVYDRIGAEADGIVSIHISSKISGTWNSARLGAAESSATCRIDVVDSGQASAGLGLVVLAAAGAANREALMTRSLPPPTTQSPGPSASPCSRRWSTCRKAGVSAGPRRCSAPSSTSSR